MTRTTTFATWIAAALALAACTTPTSSASNGPNAASPPSGGSGEGGGAQLPGGEASAGTFDRPGFGDVHLAAASDGSIHLVFVDGASSATWYARCEANCGDPASWSPVKIAPNAIATGYQSANGLAVDASGRVHMLLTESVYATCASGCEAPASWSFTSLDALEPGAEAAVFRAFDVAPSGALSFVTRSGNYYTCASDCTNVASWKPVVRIAGTPLHLRVDGKGGVHVLLDAGQTPAGETQLAYARCASACDQLSSWALSEQRFLAKTQSYSPSLAATASGRVYLTYQQGTLADGADPNNGQLVVRSCAGADCTNLTSWTAFSLPGDPGEGEEGTWIEAAGEGLVLASATGGGDLYVRTCESGCDAASGWSEPIVADTSAAVAASLPQDLVTCGGAPPESSSYQARFPSIAISSKGAVAIHQPLALVKCAGDSNIKSTAPIGRVIASF
jgi:hypothetical protein